MGSITTSNVLFCHFRPNFFQMCTPDWENLDCGTKSDPKFITDYECRGNEELIIKLSKDMHRSTEQLTSTFKRHAHTSFFSGHASVAWSSASFIYLYLEGKFKNEKVTKIPFLVIKIAQMIVIGLASWVSYTRITDYWHHQTDVLTGAIVGMVCQYVNVRFLMQLF